MIYVPLGRLTGGRTTPAPAGAPAPEPEPQAGPLEDPAPARAVAVSALVGDVLVVADGSQVTRPDGTVVTVSGCAYVLDHVGVFVLRDALGTHEVTVS